MTTEASATEPSTETAAHVLPTTDGALKTVRTNVYWAAGAGLLGGVPIPWLDFAAVTAVNVKMLRELANYYDLEFRSELAKSAVGALIGGATAPWLTFGAIGAVTRFIPGYGSLVGLVTGPIMSAAVTYAVGKVFVLHFGSGGTFLDFDPEKFRDYFNVQLEKGREQAEAEQAPSAAEAKKNN